MKKLVAVLAFLFCQVAFAQELQSWANYFTAEPVVPCDNVMRIVTFHPSPGNTIYVREMQAWPWPQPNWVLVANGFIAIQKYSADQTKQTFMDLKHFYGNPNPIAKPDFAGGSMKLEPSDLIMIEMMCSSTQFIPGFQPRYQVLWSTTP